MAGERAACGVLDICDICQHEAAPVWTADELLSSVPSVGPGAASQASTWEMAVALVGVMLPRCSWNPEATGGDAGLLENLLVWRGLYLHGNTSKTDQCGLHGIFPHSRARSFVDPALQ